MPLVVLAHGIPFGDAFPGWPTDTMEGIMSALQEDLAQRVPNARLAVATESGHNIHQDQPELVIEAIRQVVDAVRDPSTWATNVRRQRPSGPSRVNRDRPRSVRDRRTPMHRFAPLTFGLVLVLLLGVPAAVAATAVPPSTVPVVAATAIAWEPCATPELPTQECAAFAVPLDYDEPDGATISLALARVPATDQANRIGSLILNPGGPGVAGLLMLPQQYAALPEAVRERFDVVEFDPRGIGESAPVHCFASSAEQVAAVAKMPRVPVGPEEEAALQQATAEMIQGCAERNADTLAHLSTANVARDMDRLRQAVGDEALTYIGTSYGTFLGETYANLFPDTIRAMVLDGVVNPPSYVSFDHGDGDIVGSETTSFMRILSPEGSADAFQEFFAECAAAGPDRCAFAAGSAAETREKFDALMDRLRSEPMIVQGPAGTLTVTYSLVVDLMWQTLYRAPAWPIMAGALQRLEDGDTAGFLVTTGAIGGPPSPVYLNEPEGRPAINCLDTDNPHDPALYPEIGAARRGTLPLLWLVVDVFGVALRILARRGRRSLHRTVGRRDQCADPPHQPGVRSGHAPWRGRRGRRDAGQRPAADHRWLGARLLPGRPQHLRRRVHGRLPHRPGTPPGRHRLCRGRCAFWRAVGG